LLACKQTTLTSDKRVTAIWLLKHGDGAEKPLLFDAFREVFDGAVILDIIKI
jgi:hypothetical protein